jgi:hypothetical protein
MNALQKKLLSALPEHLQSESKIKEIARKNGVSFEESVSMVFLKDAEQKEKNAMRINNNDIDILGSMLRNQKNPVVRLAQTYALTIREADTIINAQLMRLGRATSDELYAAGCAYLADKTFNSARSQIRRETQSPVRAMISLDSAVGLCEGSEFTFHEVVDADGSENPLDWIVAAESVQAEIEARELAMVGKATDCRHIEIEQSELEKTPEDIAKALNVTTRRGQQIVKSMRTAAIMRQSVVEGGAGQQELF